MDAPDGTTKPRRKPPNAGKGRKKGSKNLATLVGKTVQDTFRNFLGLDDEAVVRTGMIDGKGYSARERLAEMYRGERTPDPAYTNLLKVGLSYAYGTPGKMQVEGEKRKSLVFVTTTGLYPWDDRMDNMKPITDRMLEQKAQEERLQLEAKPPAAGPDPDEPEGLEVVQEPPLA
jgi:hypothetical protein